MFIAPKPRVPKSTVNYIDFVHAFKDLGSIFQVLGMREKFSDDGTMLKYIFDNLIPCLERSLQSLSDAGFDVRQYQWELDHVKLYIQQGSHSLEIYGHLSAIEGGLQGLLQLWTGREEVIKELNATGSYN